MLEIDINKNVKEFDNEKRRRMEWISLRLGFRMKTSL